MKELAEASSFVLIYIETVTGIISATVFFISRKGKNPVGEFSLISKYNLSYLYIT